MTTLWGPINGHLRVGIDYYTIPSATNTTIKWTVYVQSVGWGFQDTQTINLSNAVTWTKNYNLSSPNGGTSTVNVGVWTTIVPTSTANQVRTLTARVSGAYNGASPSLTRSVTIAGTAPAPPDAPVDVRAVHINDFDLNMNLDWPASAYSGGDPVNGDLIVTPEIQRQVGTGDFEPFQVDGSAGYFDDLTTLPNNEYTYRVRGKNSAGVGPWTVSNTVYTTPAAPSNLVAKALSPSSVNLKWTSNSPYATGWVIYDNGKPLNQAAIPDSDYAGGKPDNVQNDKYISTRGRYEAFPYGANTDDRTVSLWAWRDGMYHVDSKGSVIRFISTDSNGESFDGTWSWDGGAAPANSYCSPSGLQWDEANQRWVMLLSWITYTDSTDAKVSKRWAQIAVCNSKEPANVPWKIIANVNLSSTSWWFPNDIVLDKGGSRWIVAGYGQLPGDTSSNWQELMLYSDDQGATWKLAPLISGLPASTSWAEPRIRKLQDGSWYMLMRGTTPANQIHYSRSPDGINWTYGGVVDKSSTGNPDFIQVDNGNLAVYLRTSDTSASGSTPSRMGNLTSLYSKDNGATWSKDTSFTSTNNPMVYAAATIGTDGLPMVLYAIEDGLPGTKNPMTASIHLRMFITDLTGTVVPDPSGAGYTITGLDPTVPHSFSVQALAGTLLSAPSNTTPSRRLLSTPGAPTDLVPFVLMPQESGIPTRLSWNHTSTDTTPQTAYTLQYRQVGSSTWTVVPKTTSNLSYYDIPGGPQPENTKWEWQVQTWGATTDPSPWSDIAQYGVYSAPSLTLTYPVDGDDNYQSSDGNVDAKWTFSSTNGATQIGVYVLLEDLSQNTIIDTFAQAGDFSTWVSDRVIDGHQYVISITAVDSNNLLTPPASATFTVHFEPPPTPVIDAVWSENGYVKVDYSLDPTQDGAPAVTLILERSVEGGDWETLRTTTVTSPADLTQEYIDVTAPMAGHVKYRVTAVSAMPSTSSATAYVHVPAHEDGYGCGVWLSGGPGFMQLIYLRLVTAKDLTTGRNRVANNFAGRTYPVETSKSTIDTSLAITATLQPVPDCHLSDDGPVYITSPEIEGLFHLPGPHLYRDATGRTMYCYLSDVGIGQNFLGKISFTVTQAERGTDSQLLALAPYQTPREIEIAPGEYTIIGGDLTQVPPGQWQWDDGSTN